jgi:3-carboxy-cis,cis-muconate cycloisomerase
MASATDSVIFRNLFSTVASSAIWSDASRTAYYLRFEAALATAQARLGIIPAKAAQAITDKCVFDLIDMEELERETQRIGYPVLPVVKQLVRMVNEVELGLGEWAHWGATTQVGASKISDFLPWLIKCCNRAGCHGHSNDTAAARHL